MPASFLSWTRQFASLSRMSDHSIEATSYPLPPDWPLVDSGDRCRRLPASSCWPRSPTAPGNGCCTGCRPWAYRPGTICRWPRRWRRGGVAVVMHEWRGIGSSDRRAGRRCNWGYRELLQDDLPATKPTSPASVVLASPSRRRAQPTAWRPSGTSSRLAHRARRCRADTMPGR